MKKGILLSISGLMVVLLGLLFACQKENNNTITQQPTEQNQTVSERQNACPNITVAFGANMTFCGVNPGAGTLPACTTCCGNAFSIVLPTNSEVVNIGNGDCFYLTNPDNFDRNVALGFNCALPPTMTRFVIPANSTVRFFINVVNGCCIPTIC